MVYFRCSVNLTLFLKKYAKDKQERIY